MSTAGGSGIGEAELLHWTGLECLRFDIPMLSKAVGRIGDSGPEERGKICQSWRFDWEFKVIPSRRRPLAVADVRWQ